MRALVFLIAASSLCACNTLRLINVPTHGWSRGGTELAPDDPEVSQAIRSVEQVYIFPSSHPEQPRPDDKHMRLLDNKARDLVVRLLGNQRNWLHSAYTLISPNPEPKNIGLLFRSNRRELILFFSSSFTSSAGMVIGTLNGQHIRGMLKDEPGEEMERWTRQYGRPELAARERSN